MPKTFTIYWVSYPTTACAAFITILILFCLIYHTGSILSPGRNEMCTYWFLSYSRHEWHNTAALTVISTRGTPNMGKAYTRYEIVVIIIICIVIVIVTVFVTVTTIITITIINILSLLSLLLSSMLYIIHVRYHSLERPTHRNLCCFCTVRSYKTFLNFEVWLCVM